MRLRIVKLCVWCMIAHTSTAFSQRVVVLDAPTVVMPAQVDSNSPAFWQGGEFHVFNSTGNPPVLSRGTDQFLLRAKQPVQVDRQDHVPMWIEAIWQDSDGTLYGWYHNEPGGICPNNKLTAPQIGAVVSNDGGKTFTDLGIVLSSGDPVDCGAKNGFFAGGHGDFSVILDQEQSYFYFLFGNYGGDVSGQGVAMARMAYDDRKNPVGTVWKYFDLSWSEPGLGGRVTPIFHTLVSWQEDDTDSYWGPSVHWNTYLESYVVLMSHACCRPNWPQEGIYVTFNPDLSSPYGWSAPRKILGKVDYDAGFYPQVLGTEPGETDTLAGQEARLYVHGRSMWELVFWKIDPNAEPEPEPEPEIPASP